MAKQLTPNLGLVKSDYAEKANVEDLNQNFDKLDEAAGDTEHSISDLQAWVPAAPGSNDQILRSNGDGTTRWDNAATSEEIGEAVTGWLEENVPSGTTVVIDKSLTVENAAAEAKATGEELSNLKSALSFDEYLINRGTYTIKADDLESGTWLWSTKSQNPARARCKNLLPVRAGMTITYSSTTFDTFYGVLETPTSSGEIQTIGWKTNGSGTIDITKDGWLTFVIRNHANTTANVNPADYDGTVTITTQLVRDAAELTDVIGRYSTYPISEYFYNKKSSSHNGVTYTWGQDGKCTVTGTATGTSVNNLFANETALPPGIEIEKPYIFNYVTSDPNVKLSIACFIGNTIQYFSYEHHSRFVVPAGTVGMAIRLYVASGVSFATPAVVSCVDILAVDSLYEAFNNLKKAIAKYNSSNLLSNGTFANGTSNGVTFSWNADMTVCTANGTNAAAAASLNTIFSGQTRLPDGVVAGNDYYLKVKSSTNNLRIRIYTYVNGAYATTIDRSANSKITIPANTTGMSVFVAVPAGASVSNATIQDIALLSAETNEELALNSLKKYEPSGSTFSVFADMPDMSYWIGQKTYIENDITGDVVNLIAGWSYFVYKIKQLVCIVSPAAGQFYCGQIRFSDNYQYWFDLTKTTGDVHNNYYTTEHYDNTYNISCSPTITADTNNYLASTGDTTDRTGDIQTMLNTNHVCRLGPGVFYVTGIDVPNLSMLIGCGTATKLILSPSVTNGYAVKLNSYTQLKDVYVKGSASNITPTDPLSTSNPVNNRHGVLFEATANAENPTFVYRAKIEGCTITDFEYGGITCYNTGLNPGYSLCVVNCQIARCGAGINLQYFTEFHRFTNIASQDCYYGCIDNGGNNNFANCDFSMNKLALLIDNSTDQSRNNTHGTFSACSFHHSSNVYSGGVPVSVGTAIKILKASAGEIFSGCQIGYGDIEIDRSIGIRFIGCNIISKVAMRITNSPLVTFSDCTFWDSGNNPLTESGNTRLTYDNCYTRLGASFDPMA